MECILFIGDVMPGRLLSNKKTKIADEIVCQFNSASLRICNLEGVITNRIPSPSHIKRNPKQYLCKHGISTEQASALSTLKIDCCNLANNHILDYGTESLKDTIQFLNTSNIKWFGFGKDWNIASKPRIVKWKKVLRKSSFNYGSAEKSEQKMDENCSSQEQVTIEKTEYKVNENPHFSPDMIMFKVAIFGLADHFVEWKAEERHPGINYFNIGGFLTPDRNPNRERWTNIEYIRQQIEKVRHSVDLVVFSIHWGNNFQEKVSSTFQAFAHALIDMDVDIIHGHSTHHVQAIEVYKRSVVLYGCGDFLNDYDMFEEVMMAQHNETLGREYTTFRSDLSFIYKLFFRHCDSTTKVTIEKIELFPTQIRLGSVECCSEENKEWLFMTMVESCKQFNTNIFRAEDVLMIHVT